VQVVLPQWEVSSLEPLTLQGRNLPVEHTITITLLTSAGDIQETVQVASDGTAMLSRTLFADVSSITITTPESTVSLDIVGPNQRVVLEPTVLLSPAPFSVNSVLSQLAEADANTDTQSTVTATLETPATEEPASAEAEEPVPETPVADAEEAASAETAAETATESATETTSDVPETETSEAAPAPSASSDVLEADTAPNASATDVDSDPTEMPTEAQPPTEATTPDTSTTEATTTEATTTAVTTTAATETVDTESTEDVTTDTTTATGTTTATDTAVSADPTEEAPVGTTAALEPRAVAAWLRSLANVGWYLAYTLVGVIIALRVTLLCKYWVAQSNDIEAYWRKYKDVPRFARLNIVRYFSLLEKLVLLLLFAVTLSLATLGHWAQQGFTSPAWTALAQTFTNPWTSLADARPPGMANIIWQVALVVFLLACLLALIALVLPRFESASAAPRTPLYTLFALLAPGSGLADEDAAGVGLLFLLAWAVVGLSVLRDLYDLPFQFDIGIWGGLIALAGLYLLNAFALLGVFVWSRRKQQHLKRTVA
jgi:hypothetical protein